MALFFTTSSSSTVSRSQVHIAPIPSNSFLMAAIASSRERISDLGSCLVTRAGAVPSSSDLGGHSRPLPHQRLALGSALQILHVWRNGIKPCLTLVGMSVVTHSASWTASCKPMFQQPCPCDVCMALRWRFVSYGRCINANVIWSPSVNELS